MNFDGEFIHIGDIDITAIKQQILTLTDEHWLADSTRQQRYEVHTDTQTIGLVWDEDFRHTLPSKLPALQKFGACIQPVLAQIASYYEDSEKYRTYFQQQGQGYFIRANFVKLTAGGTIIEHKDKNFSLAHSHRIHIPIITNDDVLFNIGDVTINIMAGEIVEINNRLNHSVKNNGEQDRVHLILDWVIPNEKCCCSYKHHPDQPCSPQTCLATDRLTTPCTCYS